MPTDPAVLRDELDRRGLALIGAFVPVRLRDPDSLAAGIEHALRVARLLAAVVPEGDRAASDRSSSSPTTTSPIPAAPCTPGASPRRWRSRTTSGRATPVAPKRSRARCGRRQGCARSSTPTPPAGWRHRLRPIAFLPRPIRRSWVSSSTPGITCSAPATRDPSVVEAMDRWADRIWYIHFKDNDRDLARRSREEGWDYFQALRAGIFSELGQGGVDFPAVVRWLRRAWLRRLGGRRAGRPPRYGHAQRERPPQPGVPGVAGNLNDTESVSREGDHRYWPTDRLPTYRLRQGGT